ncbi:MAG: hypothetical protein ACREOZ_05205 [Gloeomargaritales cyanobacterium]
MDAERRKLEIEEQVLKSTHEEKVLNMQRLRQAEGVEESARAEREVKLNILKAEENMILMEEKMSTIKKRKELEDLKFPQSFIDEQFPLKSNSLKK